MKMNEVEKREKSIKILGIVLLSLNIVQLGLLFSFPFVIYCLKSQNEIGIKIMIVLILTITIILKVIGFKYLITIIEFDIDTHLDLRKQMVDLRNKQTSSINSLEGIKQIRKNCAIIPVRIKRDNEWRAIDVKDLTTPEFLDVLIMWIETGMKMPN